MFPIFENPIQLTNVITRLFSPLATKLCERSLVPEAPSCVLYIFLAFPLTRFHVTSTVIVRVYETQLLILIDMSKMFKG